MLRWGRWKVSWHTDTCVLWSRSTINHRFLYGRLSQEQQSHWVQMDTAIAKHVRFIDTDFRWPLTRKGKPWSLDFYTKSLWKYSNFSLISGQRDSRCLTNLYTPQYFRSQNASVDVDNFSIANKKLLLILSQWEKCCLLLSHLCFPTTAALWSCRNIALLDNIKTHIK